MTFNENGLILKEQNIGERDKLVTVLTANHGVLRAFVRGAKAVKSKKQSADTPVGNHAPAHHGNH